jgi:hypothetical protein
MFQQQNPMATAAAEGQRQAAEEVLGASLRKAMSIGAAAAEAQSELGALKTAYQQTQALLQDFKDAYGDPEQDEDVKKTLDEHRAIRDGLKPGKRPA